jgi:hypothetical protein
LILDAKGDLFGAALGSVFELVNTGTVAAPSYTSGVTTLASFGLNSANGGLLLDANGDLFGTTRGGGLYGDGSVFEIVNNGTVAAPSYASTPITLFSFNGSNGSTPNGGLIADANGDLIGTTQSGGAGGSGEVFELTNTGYVVPDPVTIANGASFEIASASADAVTFAGNTGTLLLDRSQGFVGTIADFGGQDQIDLGDIAYSDVTSTLDYWMNSSNTGGTLTVSDGTHTANLTLFGQYAASSFAMTSDGHGGTLITDPPVTTQNPLTTPHG